MQELEPQMLHSLWVGPAVLIIVVVGSIVQAGLGMGFGLTVAPVLALIDPFLVPASALFMGMATGFAGAISEREHIVWREVWIGMSGRCVGILVGLFLLLELSDRKMFSLVFGFTILLALFLTATGWRLKFNRQNLVSMGVISGFTGIITSVGAPPLALIYHSQPAVSARATLATFFGLGGAVSLIVLYVSGWANSLHFWFALVMVPSAIVGTWFGRRIRGKFNARYQVFLLSTAAFASILLISRGWP